jgi:hypothetical protein
MSEVMTGAAATPPGAPPSPPSTPAEAAGKLAERRADRSWGEKLLSQDPATLSEFHALSKLVAQGSDVDRVMSGERDLPNNSVDGKLSLAKIAGEIPSLRESGLSDGVIRELLEGRESTPAELDAVKRLKAARHSSEEWVKKYLSGEHEAVRESRLMSIILMQAPA